MEIITVVLACTMIILLFIIGRDVSKISTLETHLMNLQLMATENVNNTSSKVWQSRDGKYVTSNLEDLLGLVLNDPDGVLTSDEVSDMKRIFEKILGDAEQDLTDDE